MEKRHLRRLREKFGEAIVGKPIIFLHIPDEYQLMDEHLIERLRAAVLPNL